MGTGDRGEPWLEGLSERPLVPQRSKHRAGIACSVRAECACKRGQVQQWPRRQHGFESHSRPKSAVCCESTAQAETLRNESGACGIGGYERRGPTIRAVGECSQDPFCTGQSMRDSSRSDARGSRVRRLPRRSAMDDQFVDEIHLGETVSGRAPTTDEYEPAERMLACDRRRQPLRTRPALERLC
jgi:hypothetical protein